MSPRVDVKLFGGFQLAFGESEMEADVRAGSSVTDLWLELCRRSPALASSSGQRLIAVNEEYSGEDRLLSENDVVAFFPPVSGG